MKTRIDLLSLIAFARAVELDNERSESVLLACDAAERAIQRSGATKQYMVESCKNDG